MKTKRYIAAGLTFTAALIFVSSSFAADIYMKMKQHSDAFEMMGQKQPAKDVIQDVWMAKEMISTSDAEQTSIIRLDKGVIYMINHKEKKYAEIPLDMSKMMPDMEGGEMAGMKDMMQNMMKMKITITPTGEKKKINNWNCQKYMQQIEMFMGPMTAEVWATEDIKIDADLYANYASSMFRQMPGMQAYVDEIQKEMKKIKGVTVLSTTEMAVMGQKMKSSMELMEVKEGNAPSSAFEVPKGYKKEKMEGMPR